MLEIYTHSVEETIDAGKMLGKVLIGGDVVCLTGNLGTGKTAFTSGIAKMLGIKGYITSPTFTIVNEYKAKIPLYHFDVYRLSYPEELYDIGFEEYIYSKGITVIEWADTVESMLPHQRIWVNLEKDMTA